MSRAHACLWFFIGALLSTTALLLSLGPELTHITTTRTNTNYPLHTNTHSKATMLYQHQRDSHMPPGPTAVSSCSSSCSCWCPGAVWNASAGVFSYRPHLMYTYWVNHSTDTGETLVTITLRPSCQTLIQANNEAIGRSEWLVCDAGDAGSCASQLDNVDWSSSPLSLSTFPLEESGPSSSVSWRGCWSLSFRLWLLDPGWHHVSVRLLVWNMSADVAQLDVAHGQIVEEAEHPQTTHFTGFQGQQVMTYIPYTPHTHDHDSRHSTSVAAACAASDSGTGPGPGPGPGARAGVDAAVDVDMDTDAGVDSSLVWSVHLSSEVPVAPSPHLCGGRHWLHGRWMWHPGTARRVFSPYSCMLLRVLDDSGLDVEFQTLVTWLRHVGWLMLVGDSNTRYLFGHLCEWFRATRTVSPKSKYQTEYCYGEGWFISYHSWWITQEHHISQSPTGNSSFTELTCTQQILSITLCHEPPQEITRYHIHHMDGPTLTYFSMGSHSPEMGANHVTRQQVARHVRHPHMSNHRFVMSGVPAPNTAAIPPKFPRQYQYRNLIRTEALNGLLYQELTRAHLEDVYRNGTGLPGYQAWLPWLDIYALTAADFSSRAFHDAIHFTTDIQHHILLYLRQYTLYAPQFKPWRQQHGIPS